MRGGVNVRILVERGGERRAVAWARHGQGYVRRWRESRVRTIELRGTRVGCLRTLLIARTKLKLFKAQRVRGGASSEVLRRLERALAGALIDYLITSIGIGPFHLRSQLPSCCRAPSLQQTAAWSRTSNTTLLHHSAASMSGTSTFDTFLRRHER